MVKLQSNMVVKWAAGVLAAFLLLWWASRAWHPSRDSYPQQGIEVSAVHGKVDWPLLKADSIDFAYVEATQGDTGRDPEFTANWQGSFAAGVQRGALHRYNLCRLARDQATNFITTVPREAVELPAAIDLDFDEACTSRPDRAVLMQELATFIRMAEAHIEKPVILKLSRAFENEYAVSRAIDRPLWLTSFLLTPSYGERPWIMWRANGSRSVEGLTGTTSWSVLRP